LSDVRLILYNMADIMPHREPVGASAPFPDPYTNSIIRPILRQKQDAMREMKRGESAR
jgi:hypothetical protein